MYELIRLSEHDYYVDCPSKIGLVRFGDSSVAAIDSGNNRDAAKKVLKHIEANGWQLAAVYVTHSHADHIGGCRLLQDRTGCRVYARGMECDFTNHTLLEPMTLYGGFPPEELRRSRFLTAQECRAEPLTEDVLPEGMALFALPGHSYDMVGFRTADGNAFIADSVSSAETLRKYGVGYLWDVGAQLRTLELLPSLEAQRFIPAHAPVSEEIGTLSRLNADAVRGVAAQILALCAEPTGFDGLLKRVFDVYGMTMTAEQHALIGNTLRSYLSWLKAEGKAECRIEENRMLWQRVGAG